MKGLLLSLLILMAPVLAFAETRAIADSHTNAFYGVNQGPNDRMCATGLGATSQRLLFVGKVSSSYILLDSDAICAPAVASETAATTDCSTGGDMLTYACASTESKVDACTLIGTTNGVMTEASNGTFAANNGGVIEDNDEIWVRPPTGLASNAPYAVCLTLGERTF